jgi:hypothetical protein
MAAIVHVAFVSIAPQPRPRQPHVVVPTHALNLRHSLLLPPFLFLAVPLLRVVLVLAVLETSSSIFPYNVGWNLSNISINPTIRSDTNIGLGTDI